MDGLRTVEDCLARGVVSHAALPAPLRQAVTADEFFVELKAWHQRRGTPFEATPLAIRGGRVTEKQYLAELLALAQKDFRLFPYHLDAALAAHGETPLTCSSVSTNNFPSVAG